VLASLVGRCNVFLAPHPLIGKTKEKNMPKKRTNKRLGGSATQGFGSILGTGYTPTKGKFRDIPRPEEESDESRRKRLLAKRRKRATAAKDLEVAMEEKGKKLPRANKQYREQLAEDIRGFIEKKYDKPKKDPTNKKGFKKIVSSPGQVKRGGKSGGAVGKAYTSR